jgi:hypothetical protein
MAPRRRPEPPEECSQCGTEIPRSALACPECGADEKTGWDTNPWLPDPDVDIPDYLTEDHDPAHDPPIFDHQPWTRRGWWIVAALVLLLMAFMLLRPGHIMLLR